MLFNPLSTISFLAALSLGLTATAIPQTSCPAGEYQVGGVCHPCPPGTYQPNAGATSCIPTDPNFYAPAPGETMESPCPPGTCSPGLSATCSPC